MNRILTLEEITAAVKQYAPQYNLRRVWLFGSYARGEATLQSDLDLCIEYGDNPQIYDRLCLIDDIREHFDIDVDVIESEMLTDEALKTNVLRERICLYQNSCPKQIDHFAALRKKHEQEP